MVRRGRGHRTGAAGLRQGAAAAAVRGDYAGEEGFDRDMEFGSDGRADAGDSVCGVAGVVGKQWAVISEQLSVGLSAIILLE